MKCAIFVTFSKSVINFLEIRVSSEPFCTAVEHAIDEDSIKQLQTGVFVRRYSHLWLFDCGNVRITCKRVEDKPVA